LFGYGLTEKNESVNENYPTCTHTDKKKNEILDTVQVGLIFYMHLNSLPSTLIGCRGYHPKKTKVFYST
jgi:hypothetical protein